MPYKLRKAPLKDLYWVVSKRDPKEHLSKEPLSKEKALAQMRAVYRAEGLSMKTERAKQGGMIMTGIGLSASEMAKQKADVDYKAYVDRTTNMDLGVSPVLSIDNNIYIRADLVGKIPEQIHFSNRYLRYHGNEQLNGVKYFVYTIDLSIAYKDLTSLDGGSLKGILSGIVKFFAPNLHKNISTFGQRDRSRY